MNSIRILLFAAVSFFTVHRTVSKPDIKNWHQPCFAHLKDLNILYMRGNSRKSSSNTTLKCDPENPFSTPQKLIFTEAFRYAIEKINQRPDILPNVSLGYVILDTCFQDLGALAAMLFNMPDLDDPETFPDDEIITCKNGMKRFTNVIGGYGPTWSAQAVMIGGLSTLFDFPLVLPYSTSDELSDKTRFAYTIRLSPPDRFAAEAIIDLMVELGWNYASLLYMEGAYGENGAKQVERRAKEKGICLAFTFMFHSDYTLEEVSEAATMMEKYAKAKVIIAYIVWQHVEALLPELEKRGLDSHFYWLGSDAFPIKGYGGITDGAMSIDFYRGYDEEFEKYFNAINLMNSPDIPYMKYFWPLVHDCSWNSERNKTLCQNMSTAAHGINPRGHSYGTILDGIKVFAKGLDRHLRDKCPGAMGNRQKVRDCFDGKALFNSMIDTSFNGTTGLIKFDEKGDIMGKYIFTQYNLFTDETVTAAVWDKSQGSLDIFYENILFSSLKNNATKRGFIPEAVCSKPCDLKEFFIQKELPCCWECRKCRENEIIVQNKTSCERCPIFTWPDLNTSNICENIEPEILGWKSPTTIAMIIISSFGFILCIIVMIFFAKHWKTKLIKASSRGLMCTMLIGIIMAYLTVFMFLAKPTHIMCYVTSSGFNISVCFIYAPLMVKTCRIYRIFSGGKKGIRKLRFTGMNSQIAMVFGCISLQILLIILSDIWAPPTPALRMLVPTEKYVEIVCNLPVQGFLPPIAINLIFILTCAVLGFLTRKLPENFNESWYIFVSVSTTTFLWLVFLPAYFTAFYAVHQIVLLCSCLILNASITLLCLYFPKIYCLYFVDEDDVNFQTAGTLGTHNQIVPIASVAGAERNTLSTSTG